MATAQQTAATAAGSEASTGEGGDAAVRLDGVARRFGATVAVARIDLELPTGEFFALLGPSGCGKTTTLRMVGGFEMPSSGRIFLDGRDVTDLPPYRRDVNTVFQSYALFPHLDVFDNVAFGLRRKGLDKADIRRRVQEILELVGLGGFARRRPAQISGGQQQRVALARALVNRPKVLLLDEPMGALDARIRKTMQLELKRIQREVGITFLYVTHDQAEAMAMSDRLAVMHAGRCEDLGPPRRVYDQPGTQFVAEFLGTCNLLPIERAEGQLRLPDGTPVAVAHADAGAFSAGWRVGVRPERLVLTPAGSDTGPAGPVDGGVNRLRAHVTTATYLGASTEYELATAWGTKLMIFAQNLDPASRAGPGDEVDVAWDATHCFLLPPAP
jgi:spermidine/putrescine transport system ATP-binding protein